LGRSNCLPIVFVDIPVTATAMVLLNGLIVGGSPIIVRIVLRPPSLSIGENFLLSCLGFSVSMRPFVR
jgi:hypothetical protein